MLPHGSRFWDSEDGLRFRQAGGPAEGPPNGSAVAGAGPEALVTSRNNSHPPSEDVWRGPWRPVPGYVAACSQGTLALYFGDGRVVFGALACRSWSCSYCRPRLAARLLDRLRSGMTSRPSMRRTLATPTLDPHRFGAVVVGSHQQLDGRWTNMVSMPTPTQFWAAASSMSREWNAVTRRLSSKARRAEASAIGYFRVIELHRSAWPHYHVVIEHPEWGPEELRPQLEAWPLGRVDLRSVDLDGAVGELAPYLTSSERKAGGSKAYQFAAGALPKGFRLYSASRGFLGALSEPEEKPDHALALRGHFSTYHQAVREMGADARLCLHAPSDGEHVPPSRTVATGDAAVVYFASLVDAQALHLGHAVAALAADEALTGRPDLPPEVRASLDAN